MRRRLAWGAPHSAPEPVQSEPAVGIGRLIDACRSSRHAAGITRALQWSDALEARGLSSAEQAQLNYFRANAWSKRRPQHAQAWRWEQPAQREAILCLRRASTADGFAQLHRNSRCEILTNLGNELNTAGRMVEALEPWHTALAIEPEFWMARGNRGRGLVRYGRSLYDDELVAIFFFYAHKDLAQAIEDAAKHPESGYAEARKYFEDQKAWIEGHLDVAGFGANFEPDDGLLGRSHAEQSYREWCLANRLFLNPINDVISRTLAAHDNLSLLDFQTKLSEPPVLIGFFNQLKQEYVTARWGYYCGVHADRAHFSDRYVSLSNTLDYSSYGLAIEQVRTAFRVG